MLKENTVNEEEINEQLIVCMTKQKANYKMNKYTNEESIKKQKMHTLSDTIND